jgi:hypothetical protein
MCRLVSDAVKAGSESAHKGYTTCTHYAADQAVIDDARRMTGEPEGSEYVPLDPKEFASRIFHTCYMGTENSSPETRKRAKDLAEAIGA